MQKKKLKYEMWIMIAAILHMYFVYLESRCQDFTQKCLQSLWEEVETPQKQRAKLKFGTAIPTPIYGKW